MRANQVNEMRGNIFVLRLIENKVRRDLSKPYLFKTLIEISSKENLFLAVFLIR